MKKNRQQKLKLDKFTVAKLNNLSSIYGGVSDTASDSDTTVEDGGQGETILTQLPTTHKPTQNY